MAGSGRMLDAVRDRILIVNRAGKIVYTNAAARGDFDGGLSGLLVQADLRHAAERVAHGRDPGPVELKLKDASGTERHISVVPAPNGTDAAVLVHAVAGDSGTGSAPAEGRTVAELMRQHLHEPLAAFTDELQVLVKQRATPTEDTISHARDVLDRLEKVMDMIAVFGGDAMSGEERLLPRPLVEQAVQQGLSEQLRSKVTVALVGFEDTLPPVYGSERWLQRAVREIVENAARHGSASPGAAGPVTVEVRAIQAGEFLTLTFRNRSSFGKAAGDVGRFVPFSSQSNGKQSSTARIGLPLAQRILEMHGGSLKLRGDDDNTEVAVQIPTGAPRFASRQLDAEQARRYAEDLAKLMARRRTPAAAAPVAPAASASPSN